VRSPEGLRFELEIKSKFNWKTESRKIQRLEFVSDKIEGEDCRREVMCICFGHPRRKWDCVRLSMGGGHGWSWSSINGDMASSWERRRGKEERGRGALLGVRLGEREGCRRGAGACSLAARLLSVVREKETRRRKKKERRKEKKRRREGKKKKKKRKMRIFPNLEISEKIKDNLWSWLEIIFVKERYVPYYK
jgi:hypothetical protein